LNNDKNFGGKEYRTAARGDRQPRLGLRPLIKPQEPDSRRLSEGATNVSLARHRVFDLFDEDVEAIE
jgi:hypothetical protein